MAKNNEDHDHHAEAAMCKVSDTITSNIDSVYAH